VVIELVEKRKYVTRIIVSTLKWRQHIPPKRLNKSMILHDVSRRTFTVEICRNNSYYSIQQLLNLAYPRKHHCLRT